MYHLIIAVVEIIVQRSSSSSGVGNSLHRSVNNLHVQSMFPCQYQASFDFQCRNNTAGHRFHRREVGV
jgi:hypothetical protein